MGGQVAGGGWQVAGGQGPEGVLLARLSSSCCFSRCCSPRRGKLSAVTPDRPGLGRACSRCWVLAHRLASSCLGSVKFRPHSRQSPPAPAHTDVITGWVGMTGFVRNSLSPAMHSNAIQHHRSHTPPRPRASSESWGSSPPSVHARLLHSAARRPPSPSRPSLDLGLAPCKGPATLCLAPSALPVRFPLPPSPFLLPSHPPGLSPWPRGRLPALGHPVPSVDTPPKRAQLGGGRPSTRYSCGLDKAIRLESRRTHASPDPPCPRGAVPSLASSGPACRRRAPRLPSSRGPSTGTTSSPS